MNKIFLFHISHCKPYLEMLWCPGRVNTYFLQFPTLSWSPAHQHWNCQKKDLKANVSWQAIRIDIANTQTDFDVTVLDWLYSWFSKEVLPVIIRDIIIMRGIISHSLSSLHKISYTIRNTLHTKLNIKSMLCGIQQPKLALLFSESSIAVYSKRQQTFLLWIMWL